MNGCHAEATNPLNLKEIGGLTSSSGKSLRYSAHYWSTSPAFLVIHLNVGMARGGVPVDGERYRRPDGDEPAYFTARRHIWQPASRASRAGRARTARAPHSRAWHQGSSTGQSRASKDEWARLLGIVNVSRSVSLGACATPSEQPICREGCSMLSRQCAQIQPQ